MNRRTVTAVIITSAAVVLAACGSDEPEPQITATPTQTSTETPTPDPTEAAEDAAIAAVERYYAVNQQAGISGDWSEAALSEGARGAALEDLLVLGEIADVGEQVYEGEIVMSDPRIDSLTLEPEPEAQVTVCRDDTTWEVIGNPDAWGGLRLLQAHIVRPAEDGEWYVTDSVNLGGEEVVPCE